MYILFVNVVVCDWDMIHSNSLIKMQAVKAIVIASNNNACSFITNPLVDHCLHL